MELWERLRFMARDMTNGLGKDDRQTLEDAANAVEAEAGVSDILGSLRDDFAAILARAGVGKMLADGALHRRQ